MRSLLILGIVAVTTLGAAEVGRRSGVLPSGRGRSALLAALGLLGVSAGFFVLNVAVGVTAALLVRGATPVFVSVYFVNDLSLVVLSLFQGLIFGLWYGSAVR